MKTFVIALLLLLSTVSVSNAGQCVNGNCTLRSRAVKVTKEVISVPVRVTKRTLEVTRNVGHRTLNRVRNIVR